MVADWVMMRYGLLPAGDRVAQRNKFTILKYIKNVFEEEELNLDSVVLFFTTNAFLFLLILVCIIIVVAVRFLPLVYSYLLIFSS